MLQDPAAKPKDCDCSVAEAAIHPGPAREARMLETMVGVAAEGNVALAELAELVLVAAEAGVHRTASTELLLRVVVS
jgi:lysozyme family protein